MSTLSSMWAGVSGLNVHGKALTSVADNIANVSTHGFKATRANFGDIMSSSLSVGGTVVSQVGSGARILSMQQLMLQGSPESTDIPTDLAINGSGFFKVVRPNTGAGQAEYYTRAGQFTVDNEGYMITPAGDRLRGYNVDAGGNIVPIEESIRIVASQSDAVPTSQVDISVNLDAEDTDTHLASQPVDPSDTTTYNYLTTVRVYDSLGVAHDLSMFYQRLEKGTYPNNFGLTQDEDSVWKVSAFERQDGVFGTTYIEPPTNYFLHFDTVGHLAGITTGLPASEDVFQGGAVSASDPGGTFGSNYYINSQVGQSLVYTPQDSTGTAVNGGAQTFISNMTVEITTGAGAAAGTVSIGGGTAISFTGATAAEAAANLASNINSQGLGVWAEVSGDQVVLHSNGNSALSVSLTGDAVAAGETLTDLAGPGGAINAGRDATAALFVNTGDASYPGGSNLDFTINGTTYSVALPAAPPATAADVATAIDNTIGAGSGLNLVTVTVDVDPSDATGNTGSIFLEATGVATAGSAGNDITITSPATGTGFMVSGSSFYGGMDGTGASDVSASIITNTDGTRSVQLTRGVAAGLDAQLTVSSSGTPLTTFDVWDQTSYANDGDVQNAPPSTEGEQILTFDWLTGSGATDNQTITFDFTPTSTAPTTQSGGASEIFYLYQNGSPRGNLESVDIDKDGIITGRFSNGTLRTLGQVLLVNFANPNGLERVGENLWVETRASGAATLNTPGTGGLGSVESGSLEQSNVDLANEFVKMIIYQRGFQANSKTVQTTDQLLQELINLKR